MPLCTDRTLPQAITHPLTPILFRLEGSSEGISGLPSRHGRVHLEPIKPSPGGQALLEGALSATRAILHEENLTGSLRKQRAAVPV